MRTLPFDQIKIDRSFVHELGKEGASPMLVEAIISIGRGLNMPIIAEGIETDAIRKVLHGMGDLKGQGFLFGEPEDAEQTLHWLAEHHLLAEADTRAAPIAPATEIPARRSATG